MGKIVKVIKGTIAVIISVVCVCSLVANSDNVNASADEVCSEYYDRLFAPFKYTCVTGYNRPLITESACEEYVLGLENFFALGRGFVSDEMIEACLTGGTARIREIVQDATQTDSSTDISDNSTTTQEVSSTATTPTSVSSSSFTDFPGRVSGTKLLAEMDSPTEGNITYTIEPEVFLHDGVWVEGHIDDTTETNKIDTANTVITDWSGYGFYDNIDYCQKYIPEGIDANYLRNSNETNRYGINEIEPGDSADYIDWLYSLAQPTEEELNSEDDSVRIAKTKLKGCLDGQIDGMNNERFITDNDESSYQDAINRITSTTSTTCRDRANQTGYLDACKDGENHPPKRDVYFRKTGETSTHEDEQDSTESSSSSGGGTSGGGGGSSGGGSSGGGAAAGGGQLSDTEPTSDDTETPAVDAPKPLEENPADVLDPCTIEAIAAGSEFYDPGQVETDQQLAPVREIVWDALLSPVNDLTPEQVAAIMSIVQNLSNYNPATKVIIEQPTTSTEQPASQSPLEPADQTPTTIEGIGLIRWTGLEQAALVSSLKNNKAYAPFFNADGSRTPYNGDAATSVSGDMFFSLAAENNVRQKAYDLLMIQVRKLLSNIDDSGFRVGANTSTMAGALNYLYNHLVMTDGTTPAPAGYLETAEAILTDLQGRQVTEQPSTDAVQDDPSCQDGFRPSPAGLTSDLLGMIQAAVQGRSTKSPVYSSALISSGVDALYDGRDAFAFVAAMIRASKFHPAYPVEKAADVALLDDLKSWKKVVTSRMLEDIKDADLKPGDILIESSTAKHTMIYIGEQDFNDKKPFVMANTGNSYPYFVDREVDKANIYNVWRRQTLPREQ